MRKGGKSSQRGEKMAKDMTLGKAYVQIVPSAEGIQGSLEKVMSNEGASSGKSFSSAFSKAAVAGISTAAIGKAIAASITEGAALEQSLGGVETLFKENADTVVAYANQAFRTAGVSANSYMEQVTSFSATLLQGLGGDTAKAAEYANTAMVDMSDNANKFGTDMASIQNAYQGFAKQNYTMLDNLKLGYGGTQAEMARLINDSGVLGGSITVTAETVKDVPFSDIITAIHTIQSNLGVTGTTAKEASETFSGSMGAMKASASNLLGHLSTGTGNLDEDFRSLADTTSTFGQNLIGMLSKINSGLSDNESIVGDVYAGVKGLAVAMATIKLTNIISNLDLSKSKLALFNAELKKTGSLSSALKSVGVSASSMAIAVSSAIGTVLARQIDKATAAIDEATDAYDSLNDEHKAFVDSTKELSAAVRDAVGNSQSMTAEAESQAAAYTSMRDRLYELDDATTLSNESKAEMQSLVSQLNESIPGLNILLDEETGHLMGQRETIDELVDSYAEKAKVQAAEESLVELYKKQYEAQGNLSKAEEERNEAYSKRDKLLEKQTKLYEEYNALQNGTQTASTTEQLKKLEQQMASVGAEISSYDDLISELDTSYITASESANSVTAEIDRMNGIIGEGYEGMNEFSDATSNASDSLVGAFTVSQESLDSISAIGTAYADAANNIDATAQSIADSLDVFGSFSWDDELDATTMINNLESNLNAMDWGTNGIDSLKQHADDLGVTIDENLLAKLEEMGPDAANEIRTMCGMTAEELQDYSDLYGKYYGMAEGKANKELDKLREDSAKQIQAIMEETEQQAMPLSDAYKYLATCAADGFAKGVSDSSDVLSAAGRSIYAQVEAAYRAASETQSPSKAMRRLGKFLSEGAALGIEDGTDIVKASAASMAKAAISSAEPLRASVPATSIDIGTVRRAAAQYDYSGTQAAVSGKADSGKPAIINLNINGRTFAQATADFIDLENGATLSLKERGVAR